MIEKNYHRSIIHILGMSSCPRWTLWPVRTRFRRYLTSIACYRKCWWWTSRIHEVDRTGDFKTNSGASWKVIFLTFSFIVSLSRLRLTRSFVRTVKKIYFCRYRRKKIGYLDIVLINRTIFRWKIGDQTGEISWHNCFTLTFFRSLS